MKVREVYNPLNHTWESVPSWTLRRFVRYWFSLLGWERSRELQARALTFGSTQELADSLKAASQAHHEYERVTGVPDANWHQWYAEWVAAEKYRENGRTD